MVRKRIYKRRTGRFRRRSRMRMRKPSKMAFAKGHATYSRRSKRLFKAVSRMAEIKKRTLGAGALNIPAGGAILQVPAIDQAVTGSGRIGNKIFMRYIRVKGYIDNNAQSSPIIRVCCVWPKNITDNNSLANMPGNINAFWDQTKFCVMYDRKIPMGMGLPYVTQVVSGAGSVTNYSANGTALNIRPFDYTMKVMKTISFDANQVIQDTIPVLFFISSDSTSNYPQYVHSIQITYTDV